MNYMQKIPLGEIITNDPCNTCPSSPTDDITLVLLVGVFLLIMVVFIQVRAIKSRR